MPFLIREPSPLKCSRFLLSAGEEPLTYRVAIDDRHPRIIQVISGKLSLRILNTNGLRKNLRLASSSISSSSSKVGTSDIVDFTEIIDVTRRRYDCSESK